MEIQLISKSSLDRFNTFISHQEFKCRCRFKDCTYTLYLERTINSFLLLREYFGEAIIVTSGYRCQRHNKKVGGLATSYHLKGCAIDLQPKKMDDLDLLESYARIFFDVVVRYDTFIHCHNLGDTDGEERGINLRTIENGG